MSSAHPITPLASLGLPRPDRLSAGLLATPGLELSFNARGALLAAFTEIARQGRRKVLLPAFHCPSAITPALMAGLQPVYYRIRRDLSIDIDDVLAKADKDTAALLVIHFFGFAPSLADLAPLAWLGIRLIEDCSHSYVAADTLQLAGSPHSDYRIYSFWKIVPSGIGGGIWRREQHNVRPTRRAAPAFSRLRNYKRLLEESIGRSHRTGLKALMQVAEGASHALSKARRTAPDTLHDLEHGETYYPVPRNLAEAAMPAHVQRIIRAADITAISQARCANFRAYLRSARRLQPMQTLASDLPADTCPWVYPVLLNDRSRWDHKLRSVGVALHTFGIYLHSSLFLDPDSKARTDAKYLAERILCLSIHQDLSVSDININCNLIETSFKSTFSSCPSA